MNSIHVISINDISIANNDIIIMIVITIIISSSGSSIMLVLYHSYQACSNYIINMFMLYYEYIMSYHIMIYYTRLYYSVLYHMCCIVLCKYISRRRTGR